MPAQAFGERVQFQDAEWSAQTEYALLTPDVLAAGCSQNPTTLLLRQTEATAGDSLEKQRLSRLSHLDNTTGRSRPLSTM